MNDSVSYIRQGSQPSECYWLVGYYRMGLLPRSFSVPRFLTPLTLPQLHSPISP